jgi:NADP-dependent 3-hydroxy acid dehydrogenase YdfG/predicted lipoprotein with Yx(FWY)xxD motif
MSKTILITGTSSGFGRDTAETLRRAGHTVYASLRGAEGKNPEAAEALRKLGIKTVELDVSDDASVEAGVENVLAEAGRIDVLVNNAGIASAGVTEAFTTEQAKAIFDTNVIGLLRVTRAVLPSMRQQHDGLIINIGSILGRVTFPFTGIYGASKFAVEALTDSLRYELSQLGVEVVEVQPSAYPTNFFTNIQTPARTDVTESYGEVGHIPDAMVKSLMASLEGHGRPQSARRRGGHRQARRSSQGQPRRPHRRRRAVRLRQGQRGRRARAGQGGRSPGPQPPRESRLSLTHVHVGAIEALTNLVASARCHANEWRNTMHKGRLGVFVPLGLIAAGLLAAAALGSGNRSTVALRTTALGKVLVAANGRTLYLFTADKGTTSTCYGQCASFWPPLVAAKPSAGVGAKASLVGTTKRKDGTRQVTYAGHPLYFFAKDRKAGEVNGQAFVHFGGAWWVVSAAGLKVTAKP